MRGRPTTLDRAVKVLEQLPREGWFKSSDVQKAAVAAGFHWSEGVSMLYKLLKEGLLVDECIGTQKWGKGFPRRLWRYRRLQVSDMTEREQEIREARILMGIDR